MRAKAFLVWLAAILASGPASSTDEPKCVDQLREIPTKLDLREPVNATTATLVCGEHGNMTLLSSIINMTAATKELCGDQYAPIDPPVDGWQSVMSLCDTSSYIKDLIQYGAVNFTTGRWLYLRDNYLFACVLCQTLDAVVSFPIKVVNDDIDATRRERFVAHLTSVDTRDSVEVDDVEKARLKEELMDLLKPYWGPDFTTFDRAWLDETKHLHVDYRVGGTILLSAFTGNATALILDGSYVVAVEDVDVCPAAQTVDAEGVVTQWPATMADQVRFATNLTTGVITRRNCVFNNDTGKVEWNIYPTRWELLWRNCTSDEYYVNEEHYKQFFDAIDIDRRHANVLQELASTPVNTTTFQEVARLVSRELDACNELSEQMERHLVNITAHLVIYSDSDHSVATAGRADLIVADLGGSEPVVGFTLECAFGDPTKTHDNVTLNRKPTAEGSGSQFAFDISPLLAEGHSRMAFVVMWKNTPILDDAVTSYKHVYFTEVTVMFPRQEKVSKLPLVSFSDHYVDFTYSNDKSLAYRDHTDFCVCVAWIYDLGEWTMEGCKTLYNGAFSACRCSGKYFALQDGVLKAKYALKQGHLRDISLMKNDFFDILEGKIALMTVTAIGSLLILPCFCFIIGTAILFKPWLQNTDHKILLHMVLALTCNLVLGFTANFKRMNTEGVGCLVYGVLRHYSFLAMFFWMLVLSLLQLKRLMTVAGAKATSHLVLKVAVFAWGVPLVPIIILLSVNPGFYKSDRFQRGYCYPEGLVFQVTVEAPAGLILLINLGIFVKIILHIFGCVGEKKITRYNKTEKAEQLSKLKTNAFIFLFFGFSWLFHFLSEECKVVGDFLFEYLFLMTVTTHIIVLTLFFVAFRESTRKDWTDLFRKKVIKSRN